MVLFRNDREVLYFMGGDHHIIIVWSGVQVTQYFHLRLLMIGAVLLGNWLAVTLMLNNWFHFSSVVYSSLRLVFFYSSCVVVPCVVHTCVVIRACSWGSLVYNRKLLSLGSSILILKQNILLLLFLKPLKCLQSLTHSITLLILFKSANSIRFLLPFIESKSHKAFGRALISWI